MERKAFAHMFEGLGGYAPGHAVRSTVWADAAERQGGRIRR